MIPFLLIYLVIYGGMQLYLYWWVRQAFAGADKIHIGLAGFLVFMVMAPMAMAVLDGRRALWPARLLTLGSHTWMAIIFWFCTLAAATDLWNMAMRGLCRLTPVMKAAVVARRPALGVFGVLILSATAWGLHEAASIKLRDVSIKVAGLPPGSGPLRIVQVSDLHLGLTFGQGRLRKALDIVEAANPHVLVCTGDLVDRSIVQLGTAARMLADVTPPLGKFAVTGNHEFYAGLEKSLAFCRAAGVRVLRGECVEVGDRLLLAGVDDPAGHRTGDATYTDEDAVLPAGDEGRATVLLKHRPEVRPGSVGRFDLQLSGHTHGGQIFPFGLITRLHSGYGPGLHRLGKGSLLFVTYGTGTWGPPLRVFAPPEVVLVTLDPAGD